MNTIDPRTMILREMKKQSISGADIARGFGVNPSSVQGMLLRPTMKLNRLAELSIFFKYNFFKEIAATEPFSELNCSVQNDPTEMEALQTQVKELEMEVKILKQVIRDLKI